jgi:hypothetical protein
MDHRMGNIATPLNCENGTPYKRRVTGSNPVVPTHLTTRNPKHRNGFHPFSSHGRSTARPSAGSECLAAVGGVTILACWRRCRG